MDRSANSPSISSSPLSCFSKTPSLPSSPVSPTSDASHRYLSPMSSVPSGTQSPVKLAWPVLDDSPPPAKKRKLVTVKERNTTYLDLMKSEADVSHEENFHLQRLLRALRRKKKIVVVAGAGISVSAGIPDFRSSNGLFASTKTQHKVKASGKHLFDASVYKHDAYTQSFHTMVREMAGMVKTASPTPFHHLLASLAKEGRLLRLYSQNIDCIDTSMAPLSTCVPLEPRGPWPPTIQLHGGLQNMVCTKCSDLKPFDGQLFYESEAPTCAMCEGQDQVRTTYAGKRSHGIGRLRPRFVLYNEFNPDEEAIGNVARSDLKTRPDAVLVVGTTLKVPGTRRLVRELCQVTRGCKDGLTAWINIDPEPKGAEFKDCWDLVVRSRCDNIARLVALPPHDCEIGDDYLVSKEQFAERFDTPRKKSIEIGIPSSPVKSDRDAAAAAAVEDAKSEHREALRAIPTPCPSPKMAAKKKPAAKAKQTQTAFGGTVNRLSAASAKATTARPRKPRRIAQAKAPPKSTITDVFKTGKSGSKEKASQGVNQYRSPLTRNMEAADATDILPPLHPSKQDTPYAMSIKLEPNLHVDVGEDGSPTQIVQAPGGQNKNSKAVAVS